MKNMETHWKVIAYIYIIFAILHMVFGGLGYLVFYRVADFAQIEPEIVNLVSYLSGIFGLILLLISIISIIGAIGLLKMKQWAKILMLVIGCVYLLIFPIGTIVGIYTIIAFISEQSNPAKI
ncbi:MAG: hypothetical protein ACNS62_25250 [Candidatus Cyclobacteriaceae bacterium M3_2C_046]